MLQVLAADVLAKGSSKGGKSKLKPLHLEGDDVVTILVVVALLVAIAIIWYFWPQIKAALSSRQTPVNRNEPPKKTLR